jgi:predicted metal-dependent phosphoesterase TrpH
MYKIDLHTHSCASPDGGLRLEDYRRLLKYGDLDYIAVTDHDTISFAKELYHELGDCIIVGEEVSTLEGEVIGLYLHERIPPGLHLEQAVQAIHLQHGLVYVPHPFETVRKGMSLAVLNTIATDVDIIEIHNGRALFQNRGSKARAWAAKHNVAGASSSDTHGKHGWGRAFSCVSEQPSPKTLPKLLKDATYGTGTAGMRGMLYPKYNRLQKRLRHA